MPHDAFHSAEHLLQHSAQWIQLFIEALGILVIAWGIISTLIKYGGRLFSPGEEGYVSLRLSLGRYLIVALELQLASDILATAVAPSWDDIGKLAVIAIIRTVLNYFLEREVDTEMKLVEGGRPHAPAATAQGFTDKG